MRDEDDQGSDDDKLIFEICQSCGRTFLGDKKTRRCLPCSGNQPVQN